MSDPHYPYDTILVSELLKHKRKTRGIKSCFPCRHRKVRCDGHVPCASCVKRGHSGLCRVPTSTSGTAEPAQALGNKGSDSVFPRPQSRSSPQDNPVSGQQDTNPVHRQGPVGDSPSFQFQAQPDLATLFSRLEEIEQQIVSLKDDLRAMATTPVAGFSSLAERSSISHSAAHAGPQGKSPGRHVVEDATGATIFLGSHSDAPLALGCRETSASGSGGRMLDDVIMAQFVPRAYPFTCLWGPDATVEEVCQTLPEETDLIRYWQAYQSTAYPFYPVLVDVEGFGLSVFEFLNTRASRNATEPDPSWLALLFAVLACGAQFTHDPVQERDLRSKVFTCSSFHCLRMSNFFYHTNLDQIQTMALICHCLRNNLDTNTAWILMGTTIRLAQSIGLHEISPALPTNEQLRRSRLWWTLIWQDTFLSFTYDRPLSSSTTEGCAIPRISESPSLSFQECVFKICQIISKQTHLKGREEHSSALDYKTELEGVLADASPFLTSKVHCRSLQDHLERLALGIHVGYAICHVSQIHLDSMPDSSSSAVAADSRSWAMQVVEDFLGLHRLSSTVCRSWAFVHNAVSCAITMHNLAYVAVDGLADSNFLAHRLVTLLESEAKASEWYDADTNVRYFGPYSRALKALKEIYSDA
ncbi:fungal-specific transcription factor domain-containing protein [Aspergillus recurvatus]